MEKENGRLQTPYYFIREKELQYDVDLLKNALEDNWGNYICSYSVKTNSLPWLLTYLRKQGFYAEVVSEAEYDIAVRLGYSHSEIVYNSPYKHRAAWEKVLLEGGYVNLDSSYELDWMKEMSEHYPQREFRVGLRVNCLLDQLLPGAQTTGGKRGRFGYCYENGVLKEAIEKLRRLPNVKVAGLHMHTSTQTRAVEIYGALAGMAVQIAREYALELDYVDMGGGYFGGTDDMTSYPDYFKAIGKELKKFFDPQKTKLIVEPGVSLISRASSFITGVIDVKTVPEGKFVVTDGSRVNLNPMTARHSYPHHMEYKNEQTGEMVTDAQKAARELLPSQWICGSTCMEHDKLFEVVEGPVLKPGDRIVYDRAGGYTICLTPLFIHYFPAVWVEKKDGSLFQAREAWTNDEYLQKNHWE